MSWKNCSCPVEVHLHEVQGSVQSACECCSAHSHRFATVSCEPITLECGDHAHLVTFRTDTCNGHYHEFSGYTTDAFAVCDGHVHYLEGETTEASGHTHCFKCVTHIENPTEA